MERLWNANYVKVMTANFSLFFAFYLPSPATLSQRNFRSYERRDRTGAFGIYRYGITLPAIQRLFC